MIRGYRLLTRPFIAAIAAICMVFSVAEIADRRSGTLYLYQDPAEDASALAAEGRWAEADLIAGFALTRPDLGDHQKAEQVARQAKEELESFRALVGRFTQGALTGEPTDMTSLLGSLTLDLFVIGDIRDLTVQGWKEATDGSGDGVILALSAIGLTTTLAPHLDWAPALMKALKRSGALTRSFIESLSRTGRHAYATGDYGKLATVVGDFGQAAKRLGPGPMRGVMASVADSGDLTRVARAARVDATGTYVLARLFGNQGVKAIDSNGKNVGALVASIKAGSRVTKVVKKTSGSLPTTWLFIILITSSLVLISALTPVLRRIVRKWTHERDATDPGNWRIGDASNKSATRRLKS